MNWLLFFTLVCGLLASTWSKLQVMNSWKTVDFIFSTETQRNEMIMNEKFIPKNVMPYNFDVWEDLNGNTTLFVTIPRTKSGIPATLATVEPDGRLKPFPDWSWHDEIPSCRMTSVFSIKIDECGRLWVLDSGVIDTFSSKRKQICSPQLLLFHLNSNTFLGRYLLSSDVVDTKSTLTTIAVDTRGPSCEDSFAYIADTTSFRLIVFDVVNMRAWKIPSNNFFPDPFSGGFDIAGVKFDLMHGINGLALGPLRGFERILYWHNLAGVHESWVKTSIIRNESYFLDDVNLTPKSFRVSKLSRMSQSAGEVMSSNGVLFFGLLGNNSIACWNSEKVYSTENIVIIERDKYDLQFISGLQIYKDKLYVISCRFQNQFVGNVDENDINYRILVGDLNKLTEGTICQTKEKLNSNKDITTFDFEERFSNFNSFPSIFDIPTFNYDKTTFNYDKTTSNYDKTTSNYDKITSNYDKITSNYDKTTFNYDKTTSNYDKTTSNYVKTTSNYDKIPSNYDKTTSIYDKIPFNYDNTTSNSNYDNIPSNYDKATSNYDKTTSIYDKIPFNYDNTTSNSNYDNIPSNYDMITSYYDKIPFNYDKTTSNYDKTTSNYDKITSNYDKTTSNYDKTTSNYVKIPSNYYKTPSNFDTIISKYDQKITSIHDKVSSNLEINNDHKQTQYVLTTTQAPFRRTTRRPPILFTIPHFANKLEFSD